MWLIVIGVVMVGLKLAALWPVAAWSWWGVLAPFAAAALWWQVSDAMGWTMRAAQRREALQVKQRREARLDAMGLRPTRSAAWDGRSDSAAQPGPDNKPGA